ncbi:hypothetical protein [Caulobacter sp. DWP3-1-3b2]|uniref:hypothetical protein n=1 Tax=Caulobacter sp. DWP3-1-3b2 TaxID=2804643 RepID=UPI003CFB3AC5
MNYEETKKPHPSVFALAILLCLCLTRMVSGIEALDSPIGAIVLGGGGWATWIVGQWLWRRNGPRTAMEGMIR